MLSVESQYNRYFIEFAYHGKPYHGWQIQPNAITVQEVLNKALTKLLGKEVNVVGAGRTDTGVHSSHFIAHLDWDGDKVICNDLHYKLNRYLPESIRIDRVQQVDPNTHSRFSAIQRTYHYLICQEKNPFFSDYAWYFHKELDLQKMNLACLMLLKTSDFTSFAKLHADSKTNICSLSKASWFKKDRFIVFEISADRFLRNMVRAIVGSLIEVGLGKLSVNDFQGVILQKSRSAAGQSVPAHGLFLTRIDYPEELFKIQAKNPFPDLF